MAKRTAAKTRVLTMVEAQRIGRALGVRGLRVERSSVDPKLWEVSTTYRLRSYAPMTREQWTTLMGDDW